MSCAGMPTCGEAPTADDLRLAACDHDVVLDSTDGVVAVRFRPCRPGAGPTSAEAARLAESLVAARLAIDAGRVRVASLVPSGRPVAFVSGLPTSVCLSISHVPGIVAAAASSDAWIGLDIVDPAEAGRGLDIWFTPDELALAPDDGRLRAVLWAAKEAAYKACRLDTEFRPRAVFIDSLDGRSFGWTVRNRFGDVHGTGRLLTIGRHVVALATTTAGGGPRPLHRGHEPAADLVLPAPPSFDT